MPSLSIFWHLFSSHPSSQPLSCLPPLHPAHPKPRLDTQSCSSSLSSRLPLQTREKSRRGQVRGRGAERCPPGACRAWPMRARRSRAGAGCPGWPRGQGTTPGGQVSQGTLSRQGPEPSSGRAGRPEFTPRGLTSSGQCPSRSLGRQVLSSLQHPCQPGAPGTCHSHPLPQSLQVPPPRDGKSGHSPRSLLDVTPPPRPRVWVLKATLGPNSTAGCSFGKTWWRPPWNRRVWLRQVGAVGSGQGLRPPPGGPGRLSCLSSPPPAAPKVPLAWWRSWAN